MYVNVCSAAVALNMSLKTHDISKLKTEVFDCIAELYDIMSN